MVVVRSLQDVCFLTQHEGLIYGERTRYRTARETAVNQTFGQLVAEAMASKGWGDYQLSVAIGLLPGDKTFNNTQVRRLRRGERKLLTRELVERLIEVLDLDADTAWHAAGLWPPGMSLEEYRRFRGAVAAAGAQTPAEGGIPTIGAWPVAAGQRACRLVPLTERRRGERRRPPAAAPVRLVPQAEQEAA
jgi:hypothetical protein